MTDLAQRLERAEAGSRELSDEVLLALGYTTRNEPINEVYSDPYAISLIAPDGSVAGWFDESRPDPSRDLNACKALTPEGWGWELGKSANTRTYATVWPSDDEHVCTCAATPELAWSAALVKAKP